MLNSAFSHFVHERPSVRQKWSPFSTLERTCEDSNSILYLTQSTCMLTESTYVCKSKFLFHANTDRGSAGYGTSEKAVQINIVLLVNRFEPAVGCNRQIFLFCFEMLLSKQKNTNSSNQNNWQLSKTNTINPIEKEFDYFVNIRASPSSWKYSSLARRIPRDNGEIGTMNLVKQYQIEMSYERAVEKCLNIIPLYLYNVIR